MNQALRHPHFEQFSQLQQLASSARSLGYRLPAEFEPQRAVLLTRPHNDETWPSGTLDKAREQFEYFAATIAKYTPVQFTDELAFPTTDSWIRDFGPITLTQHPQQHTLPQPQLNPSADTSHLAYLDFIFDGWGGKYDPKLSDDVIPQRFAQRDNIAIQLHNLILEGGSIESNGQGILITTEQCLLNQNRNTHLTKQQLEDYLKDAFNLTQIIWLPAGITGDDTDGHIDDLTRFISPDTVLTLTAPQDHPDYDILASNRKILEQNNLNVIDLPIPEPVFFEFPPDQPYDQAGRLMLPASYANFLITNNAILVPTYNQPTDDLALRIIEQAAPDHVIEPVPSDILIIGMGSLHCLSMQVPL